MAKNNPLDSFVQSATTNDFRVQKFPDLHALITNHGLVEGAYKFREEMADWVRKLEYQVNAKLQPKGASSSQTQAQAPQDTSIPSPRSQTSQQQSVESQTVITKTITQLVQSPASYPGVVFYCEDTGKWHAVSQTGNPSTWDIDPTGEAAPLAEFCYAFTSLLFPCADTGLWHKVKLSGSPPTWDIDPVGVSSPPDNQDLAVSVSPFYNTSQQTWIRVALVGTPPTWGYL